MKKYTNNTGIGLSMAVWLANDEYDHNDKVVGVTTLMKSTKQVVLAARVPEEDSTTDVTSVIASRMGTATHSAVESAWANNYAQCMTDLGYPDSIIKRIAVNPNPAALPKDCIPVYMEKRTEKVILGVTLSGQFDFVMDGTIEDIKQTGVWTYLNIALNNRKYCEQGSIYRWLNPDLITGDFIKIQFVFTDWKANEASYKVGYPATKVLEHKVELMSYNDTELFVTKKIRAIKDQWHMDEAQMVPCDDYELWRKPDTFKYYKNPAKTTGRSTNNFKTAIEANTKLAKDGYVGVVHVIKGGVMACNYCNAAPICEQRKHLIQDGSLKP